MAIINYVTEIRFGAGGAAELAQVCQALGFKKPLFITDKGVVAAGLIERILAVNDLPHFHVFDGTPSNPTEAAAREGVASFHEAGCDGIIAIGGGTECATARPRPDRYSSGECAFTLRMTPPAIRKPKAWIG